MHLTKIKTKLHELNENTNDEKILENLFQQLSDNKKDWWENLVKFRSKDYQNQSNNISVVKLYLMKLS